MNIQQSNWTIREFIQSYADEGRQSYVWLNALLDKYKTRIQYNAILAALSNGTIPGPLVVRNGEFFCTQDDYELAEMILAYENQFVEIAKNLRGRRDYFYIAVGFAYANASIDCARLLEQSRKQQEKFGEITSIEDALEMLSNAYNYRYGGEKAYLGYAYKMWQDSNGIVQKKRKREYRPGK